MQSFEEFKHLREARFYSLEDSVERQVSALVKKYSGNSSNVKNGDTIGRIKATDPRTKKGVTIPILVSSEFGSNYGGHYDPNTQQVIINLNKLQRSEDVYIITIITHEIVHALQKPTPQNKKYVAAIKNLEKGQSYNKEDYYTEPSELEAQLTGMMYFIKASYMELKDLYGGSKMWEGRRERFLTRLRIFIKTPLVNYTKHNEIELPFFAQRFSDLIEVISGNFALWKSLKSKLLNLYNELEKMD